MIVKTGSGYQVKSEKGRNLSKPNLSKGQAERRLEQVEYFKHQGESTLSKLDRKARGK